jgi:rhamnosyltransferase
MKYNFALAFVIYYPGPSFYKRISFLLAEGYYIYIYDNSTNNIMDNELFINNKNIYYLDDPKNSGLGVGISHLSKKAYKDGFQSLLFFDQDTGFNIETTNFIHKIISENKRFLDDVAVLNFSDSKGNCSNQIENTHLVINSGSLYILKNLEIIGWHDTSYFVDGVDYKFCLDASCKNFKIVKISSTPGFDHTSEQDDIDYIIFGKLFRFREYSIIRVKDYLKSSLNLILASLRKKKYKYSYIFLKYLIYYTLVQSYVRISRRLTKRKKND